MIDRNRVESIVKEWLQGKDYFLVDITVSEEDRIVVEIDHAEGVWIEDCVGLSRFVEAHLNREEEDFELEVGSAGIGQPFKVLQQYINHVGKEVETMLADGRKLTGTLKEVDDSHFVLSVPKKVKPEGAKRPKWTEEEVSIEYDQVKYTKYVISFK